MVWKEDKSKFFVNPYNFISVYGKCKRDNNINEILKRRDLISGVIDCTLITKTSIFIPNTTNEHALDDYIKNTDKDHKSYDFFSYENLNEVKGKRASEPVIPGSSTRGVIRNIYEILTNSCFSSVDNDGILSKRMPDAGIPGIMRKENDKYKIYRSKKFMARYKECSKDPNKKFDKKNYSNGEKVLFIPGSKYCKGNYEIGHVIEDIIPYDLKKHDKRYKEGYILLGGEIDNKHHFSVIAVDDNVKKPVVKIDSLENLKNLIKLYENNIENIKYEDEEKNEEEIKEEKTNREEIKREFKDYKKRIEELEENKIDAIPVFYKTVKNNNKKFIYLSPSCITREVYYNTIEKILENMGDYNPCDNVTKLCDACSLFGMVAQNGANSSRLRFTDGKYESNDNGIYDDAVTLSELATPKISSTEFYMESPKENKDFSEADIWTFDYIKKWDSKEKYNEKDFVPRLRGRKFYWHHKNGLTIGNNEPNKMNVTIRPVKKGVTFNFKIFFERITKDELKKLIWVLNLGENDKESNYCHKIGMGKPLGLGSVKIVVNSIKKRIIDLNTLNNVYRYDSIDVKNIDFNEISNEFDDKTLKEVKAALNLNSIEGTISYPKAMDIKEEETIFNWFIANKCSSSNGGKGTKPKINKTLCKATENDLTLPYYKEIDNSKKSKHQ